MGKAMIPRRYKKGGGGVIENNGRHWVQMRSGHNWTMPVKANGVWVLRSSGSGLLYSTDGINWTQSNITSGSYSRLKNGNGIWVALSSNDTGIIYSTDGRTWTQSNVTSGSLGILEYENGVWVTGSMAAGLWYSSDGKTWTQSNFTSSESTIGLVRYGGGTWVVTSSHASNPWGTLYSEDGKTWTQSNAPTSSYSFLEYHNGMWVLQSSGLFYSTDGKTWTLSLDNTEKKIGTGAMMYGNGVWVGTCANYSSGTRTGFWYSTNGIDWVQSNITSGSSYDLAYANGMWLCQSSFDGSYFSADGKTWTNLGFTAYDPAYVNGLWICSSGGYIYYSEDGQTWTKTTCQCQTMGVTSYANGAWIRAGYYPMPKDATGSGVFYSTDGKNWSQSDFPLVEEYGRIEFNPTAIKNEDGLWVLLDQYQGLYYSTLTMTE